MFLRCVESELPRNDGEDVELHFAARAEGGLKLFEEYPIDLVLTDIRLPGMSGIEFLHRLKQTNPDIPVIMMSWVDAVDMVVDAMRKGAFDYIVKPFTKFDLAVRIHRAMRMADILRRYSRAPSTDDGKTFKELIGVSPPMRRIKSMIKAIAQVSPTVLICGETGTGKEIIARTIHECSPEREGPFQIVDCTTFSEGTVESELFGHVRGSFTGAIAHKQGLIEVGHSGTVFLDEIGDLPLPLQAKLLRVIEEGELRAVGDVHSKKVKVRFLAATNQDLAEKVKLNEFRKDLFYRLNVMVLQIPPLRERVEDIPLLAKHFLQHYAREFNKPIEDFEPSAVTDLIAYPWPGNVRELRNVVERAIMLSQGARITREDMLRIIQPSDSLGRAMLDLPYAKAKEQILDEFNKQYVTAKLARHGGNVTKAADESGLSRTHFYEMIRRSGRDSESDDGQ